MRASLRDVEVLLFCALVLCLSLPMRATAGKSVPAPESALDGSLWLSSTTHNVYRIRVHGGTLYAEWINIAPSEKRLGAYIRTTCHRSGAHWTGSTSSYLRCEAGGTQAESQWCHIATRTEIFTISQDRITGRAEALTRFDCRQCKVLQKEWKGFTWMRQK